MKHVFISAGHGGKDPGAVSGKFIEKDMCLKIALACRDLLKSKGVKVTMSRTKDENDPVEDEAREANKSNADIAVSFHINAGGGDGAEIFYYKGDKEGIALAKNIGEELLEIGQNSHGTLLKDGSWLYFINTTKMTAVLVESFFLDNVKDRKIGDSDSKLKKIGQACGRGILEYLGINDEYYVVRAKTKDRKIAEKALDKCLKLGMTGKIFEK